MQPLVTEKVEDRAKDYSPTVASVRKVLEGGRIVIVGGERRQDAIDRYVEAFGCSDVEWVSLTEHGTTLPAQPHTSRGICTQKTSRGIVIMLACLSYGFPPAITLSKRRRKWWSR